MSDLRMQAHSPDCPIVNPMVMGICICGPYESTAALRAQLASEKSARIEAEAKYKGADSAARLMMGTIRNLRADLARKTEALKDALNLLTDVQKSMEARCRRVQAEVKALDALAFGPQSGLPLLGECYDLGRKIGKEVMDRAEAALNPTSKDGE